MRIDFSSQIKISKKKDFLYREICIDMFNFYLSVEKLKQASEREGEEEDTKVSLSLQLYLTALRQRADFLLPDER